MSTKTFGQQYDEITARLDAAYTERRKHPMFSPAWDVADIAVEAVYRELRELNAQVAS